MINEDFYGKYTNQEALTYTTACLRQTILPYYLGLRVQCLPDLSIVMIGLVRVIKFIALTVKHL